MNEEQIKILNLYVQEAEEAEGKWEVLQEMHSNWSGRYWYSDKIFDTEPEAEAHKLTLIS